jgi:hypothetical protein
MKVWLLTVVTFGIVFYLGHTYESASSSERLLVPPPENIENMQFGFKESVADSFWLRWVQDADTCYTYGPTADAGPEISEAPPDKSSDITYNPRHKICDYSWAFKMLDAITKLDPKFKMPYMLGAPALSVLVEDYKGASVIFERGMAAYPDDWLITYRAAYHFLFDEKDLKKAASLLIRAADRGGPNWLRSLAARLYSKVGQLELGLTTLMDYRKALTEEKQIVELDRRIAALKAELDKERAK